MLKPIGFEGQFAVKADTDNIDSYKGLKVIYIDFNDTLTPFFITSSKIIDDSTIWFKAEGLNAANDLTELMKKNVYLPLELLPPLEGKKFYFHEIVGFRVHDKIHGDIGIVKDVISIPQQNILQVMHNYTEILIPLHGEILEEIDRTNKILKINAPEGLIDLYLK